jgi:hypothetical protein
MLWLNKAQELSQVQIQAGMNSKSNHVVPKDSLKFGITVSNVLLQISSIQLIQSASHAQLITLTALSLEDANVSNARLQDQ